MVPQYFIFLDSQPIQQGTPLIIGIDLRLSTAKPICRPSLEFLVNFSDEENHHLELTQLQSTHVKLKDVRPPHLGGPQISPISVALNNLTTKAIGTCLSLCKSEPLDPWYHLQGGITGMNSMGHQLAGWCLICLTEGMCLNHAVFLIRTSWKHSEFCEMSLTNQIFNFLWNLQTGLPCSPDDCQLSCLVPSFWIHRSPHFRLYFTHMLSCLCNLPGPFGLLSVWCMI